MDEKLTPVFPSRLKPARAGVYKVHTPIENRYARWTGKIWMAARKTRRAARAAHTVAAYQDKQWQGLAEEPKHG